MCKCTQPTGTRMLHLLELHGKYIDCYVYNPTQWIILWKEEEKKSISWNLFI